MGYKKTDKSYNICDYAWPDIQEFLKDGDLIMVPFGSCELHGAHLPIGADTYQVKAIVERAAELSNVLYTEPLMFGYSPHHIRQPERGIGTITLRADTLNSILYDIGRSLVHHGFNKIIYVCGHASNLKVTDCMFRKLRYDTGAMVGMMRPWAEDYLGIIEPFMDGGPETTPGWHAGELETSQVLAYNDKLVHMERAKDCKAKIPDWLPDEFAKNNGLPGVAFKGYKNYIQFSMEHWEFAPDGVMGMPSLASKEKGEQCIEAYAQYMADALKLLKPIPWRDKIHHRTFDERV